MVGFHVYGSCDNVIHYFVSTKTM